jgi:peptide/nickel transport system substrate-binding protein/oligopeptide transport system substrate-binding protein
MRLAAFPKAALALALGLSGCSGDPETSAVPGRPAVSQGGVLRIDSEIPRSLDPATTDDAYQATVTNQIFSGLVHWDDNLNVLPEIAESWIISPDKLHYTFDLREDATFHNGRTITAEDFIYSFTRLFDRTKVEPYIIQDYLNRIEGVDAFVAGEAEAIAGLSAPDPFTLRIDLRAAYPSFLSALCMDQAKVVPSEVVEPLGSAGFARAPVGSGPFHLAAWEDTVMVLAANETYFGGRAPLDSIVFIKYPQEDPEAFKRAFLARALDMRPIREAEVPELLNHGNYFIVRRPELSMEFLGFNCSLPPFDRREVRQAVSMAVDRSLMREAAGPGFTTPVGLLPPGMPGYSPETKILPENLSEAKVLLGQMGYGEGYPLRFPIYTASHSAAARARDEALIRGLRRVHIEPEIVVVTWEDLERRIDDGSMESFFLTWVADLPDPDSFVYTLCASSGLYNMFAYGNKDVDRLLARGRDELNVPLRLSLYREAEVMILYDAPIIPLFNLMNTYAFQPGVRGVEMSPFGISGIPMRKIWFERPVPETVHAGL